MKKLLLTTFSTMAIIAPVATTVACGSKQAPKTNQPVISKGGPMSEVDLPAYLATPFTPKTLQERAIAESDDTFWNGGLNYHAFSQSISIIRGLAHAYGFDKVDPKTGKSPREEFLAETKAQLITDSATDLTIKPSDSVDIKILKLVQVTNAKTPFYDINSKGSNDARLNFLDYFYYNGGFSKDYLKSNSTILKFTGDDKLWDNVEKTQDNPEGTPIETKYLKALDVYNDPDVIGQLIMQIESSTETDGTNLRALREMKIPNMSQVFPIINDEQFKGDIVPIARITIQKTIQILSDASLRGMMQTPLVGAYNQMLFKEIDFIKSKLFDEKEITDADGNTSTSWVPNQEINSEHFSEMLKTLNNGTAHWLALEALGKGFTYEFTTNEQNSSEPNNIYEWTTLNDSSYQKWPVGADLTGLNKLDSTDTAEVFKILSWTAYSQTVRYSAIAGSTLTNEDWFDGTSRLAPTPSYGFDEVGLHKSFERNLSKGRS